MKSNTSLATSLLEVRTDKVNLPIKLADILYIKGLDKRTLVCFIDQKRLETRHSLKWYGKRLPAPEFYRCHDSFIVHNRYVEGTCGNHFLLKDATTYIPISRRKKEASKRSFELFILTSA
ncbi:MAG TPA: LytTR family transcriptional regulator DNA-binding domain-containing protein [Bacteroidales bacterium]